jgi:hypothetical protein
VALAKGQSARHAGHHRSSYTMRFSSRDETRDSNTPSGSSSRTPINRGIRRKSSNETIKSYQGSISNSSVHTVSTVSTAESADTHKDLSGQCSPPAVSYHSSESSTGQYPFIFDHKSFHSLEKTTSILQNESVSNICATREPNSDCESNSDSTTPSTPKQEPSRSGLFSIVKHPGVQCFK